jgi:hypothetical protein
VAEVPLYRYATLTDAVALVDEDDWGLVSPFRWHPRHDHPGTLHENFYASAWMQTKLGQRWVLMHRLVMGIHEEPPKILVDHRNHDGLDNRRCNLRLATHSLNGQNRIERASARRFRGVYPHRHGRWRARLKLNQKRIEVGIFDSEFDAAVAIEEVRQRVMPYAPPDPELQRLQREALLGQ